MTQPTLPTGSPIRVYLVDDQAMLRAAMRSLLGEQTSLEVVGDSGDARAAVQRIAELRPDVILLDISMPGLSGIDAIAPIRKVHSRARVLMLTHHEGDSFVEQAMRAGADGYLSKDSDPAELALAIRSVHGGRPYVSPKVARTVVDRVRGGPNAPPGAGHGVDALTSREREVFQLLAVGKTNKEVARELRITLGTAKKHRENLQRKLDCHSTAEMARLAIREGLMDS